MRTPVEVTDELFARMKEHFSDEQLVEITALLTSSTSTDSTPRSGSARPASPRGWSACRRTAPPPTPHYPGWRRPYKTTRARAALQAHSGPEKPSGRPRPGLDKSRQSCFVIATSTSPALGSDSHCAVGAPQRSAPASRPAPEPRAPRWARKGRKSASRPRCSWHPQSMSLVTDQALSCATARALPLHAHTGRWRR